jgi:hypothetical protein
LSIGVSTGCEEGTFACVLARDPFQPTEGVEPARGDKPSGEAPSTSDCTQTPRELVPSRLHHTLSHQMGQSAQQSAGLRQQVADIRARHGPASQDSGPRSPLISAQHYYPVWCALLYVAVGAGFGAGTDFQTGTEHPDAGLYNLPAILAGLGQAGDTKITWDGIGAAMAGREAELEACRQYLNAMSGLQALTRLNPRLPQDKARVEQARAELQAAVDANARTFLACLEPGYLIPRCFFAGLRDVGFGALSLIKTVPTAVVSGLSTAGPLQGAARDIATTLPHVSSAMGMATGVFHIVQAIFEGADARRDRDTLLRAEQLDKRVFEACGQDCPELLELFDHRHQARELQRLNADLLDVHAWIRGIYGGMGVGGAVTTTVLTALGGAALFGAVGMGIPGLVGVFLAGAYMVWFGVRANIRSAAQKRHDKARQTLTAQHGPQADKGPGLTPTARGRPMRVVAQRIVDRLMAPASRQGTRQALIALGLPPAAVDAALLQGGAPLLPLIEGLGSQTTSASESESLQRFHARADVGAGEQLMALERWLTLGLDPQGIGQKPPGTDSWTRHLAPGHRMGDPRHATLTARLLRRHWNDEGLRSFLQRLRKHPHELLNTPQDAWDLLQTRRLEMKRAADARSEVAGWIERGQWRNVALSLGDDPATAAHRRVLEKEHGLCGPDRLRVVEVFRTRAAQTPLGLDNIASFIAICTASDATGKNALVPQVQALVTATANGMPADEVEAFCTALGIRSLNGIESLPPGIHAGNVDAVLQVLKLFLTVSDKLRAQTLNKVVISLHTYPTDGRMPNALSRLAALRELRLRCEAQGPARQTDVDSALRLAKAWSREKLHGRALGAGEGGGVFGFGGYRLNEKGRFLRELFARCLGTETLPSTVSTATLRQWWLASDDPTYRAALRHSAGSVAGWDPISQAPDSAARFASAFALYRTPGALEKALRSRDGDERAAALACLRSRLTAAGERLTVSLAGPCGPAEAFDARACVAQLQAFFQLEALALQHGLNAPASPPGLPPDRLAFYRAALAWPNKTARAKNARAIEAELAQRRHGEDRGNPFWSAKFLHSQKAAGAIEFQKTQALYPEISATSYKDLIRTLGAAQRMNVRALQRAVLRAPAQARRWVQVHFRTRGLQPPEHWEPALATLQAAARRGHIDLLSALNALKDSAEHRRAQKRAQRWIEAVGADATESTKTPPLLD